MERLTRRHIRKDSSGKNEYYEREYNIYTEEEAKRHGIQFVHWREVAQGGWGLSDDGYVSECIKRKQYSEGVNYVFPYGQAWTNKGSKGKLEYLPHKESGTYSYVSAKPHHEIKKRNTQYKNYVTAYVKMFIAGHIDHEKLGRIFWKQEQKPRWKSKALLKKRFVQDMIDKKLSEVLTESNMDEKEIIEMMKESYTVAKKKNDASNMLRCAENFARMMGIDKPKEEKSSFEADIVSLGDIEDTMKLAEKSAPALDPKKEIANG